MKTCLKILFLFSISILQIGCTDDEAETTNITFEFNGTFNNEEFSFSNNTLQIGVGTNSAGEMNYSQRSIFGNAVPTSTGIAFDFYFDEKPNFELINELIGQEILTNSGDQKPCLTIFVFKDGETYTSISEANTDDTFEIEMVEIAENENLNFQQIETGDVISVKGKMKIISDDDVIEGNFTLKTVEII